MLKPRRLIRNKLRHDRRERAGKRDEPAFGIHVAFIGFHMGRQTDQGTVRSLSHQCIPQEIEFDEVFIGYQTFPLLEPIEHQLFVVPFLNQDAIHRLPVRRMIRCRQVQGGVRGNLPSPAGNACLRRMSGSSLLL